MKYKLINSVTKIETICDKVTIDGFDYYVSEEKATEGFYGYINFEGGDIKRVGKYFADDWKKVIACNNPNIDIPKVVDEVERLAHKDNPLQKLDGEFLRASFKRGYKKSQETHPNSDEDMIEFGDWIRNNPCVWNYPDKLKDRRTTKELLQLWKEQQAKKVYYDK